MMVRLALVAFTLVSIPTFATAAKDETLPEGATLIAEGFAFPEGPAIDSEGRLWFSDPRGNLIVRMEDGEAITVATDTKGANGMAFDKDGTLFVCQANESRIGTLSAAGTFKPRVIKGGSVPLDRPNDLVFDDEGILYFTNPGRRSIPTVIAVRPNGETGVVGDDAQFPNGLGVSPDGKTLYVCDTMGGSAIWRYTLTGNGESSDGELFVKFGRGGPDGMAMAASGNLYVALNLAAKVAVVNPKGETIREYQFPKGSGVTNVCFGGPDWKTLYITCGNSGKVYQMPVDEPGLVPYSHRK